MRLFNSVSAFVTATVVAWGVMAVLGAQLSAADGWWLLTWIAGALVWATVFTLVRDGTQGLRSVIAYPVDGERRGGR